MVKVNLERVVRRWDEQLRSRLAPGSEPIPAVLAAKSVLRPPAPESAIVAAEARLGVKLPPSYREFLAVSNGAYADPVAGVITAQTVGMTRSREPGLGLLPVAEIASLAEADPNLYRVWAEDVGAGGRSIQRDGDEVEDYAALARGAIVVGSAYEGATVLVRVTRAAEWQLWVLRKEGTIGYRSFGSWLRAATDEVPIGALADLLTRYDAGDTSSARDILRVRDPAAVPVLAAHLRTQHRSVDVSIAALAAIGTAEAALALEPLLVDESAVDTTDTEAVRLSHRATQALTEMRTPVAGDVLARHGWHLGLGVRRDPRAGPLAVAALTPPYFRGANSLRLLGDPSYLPALREAAAQAEEASAKFDIALARYELGDAAAVTDLEAIAADDDHPNDRNARAVLGMAPRSNDERR